MTSAELITHLQRHPEKEVMLYWDGCPRGDVNQIYLEDGSIVLVDSFECYDKAGKAAAKAYEESIK